MPAGDETKKQYGYYQLFLFLNDELGKLRQPTCH